jgi:hypothetical protein
MELNMMVMTGGAERTEAEYRDLLAQAGFRMERVLGTRSPFSVIEALIELDCPLCFGSEAASRPQACCR